MATAQSASFTLEQCIEYALKNNFDVQNALLDEQSATSKVKETIGMGLPQVNGSVSVVHNKKLARFFQSRAVAYNFAAPEGLDYADFFPELGDNDVVAIQNFFQLRNNGGASVDISQLIFNGSYFVGLQASQAFKDLSVKQTLQTRATVIEQVTKAYYLALINKERISLFDNNINRVDTLLRNTEALNKNGFAESIDVDRLSVMLNNLKIEREKFVNLQILSLELLKFQMNYPLESALTLAGNIADVNPSVDQLTYAPEGVHENRPEFQVLEVNKKLQQLNIKNNYASALPTISAFANLGYSTQSPTFGGVFATNSPSSPQFNDAVGPDKWYGTSMFGLSLNMPIFSGFQLKYRVQQEKVTLLKIENGIKQLKSGINLEIKNSTIEYQNALKTMDSQKKNMELSAKVARVTKIKYEQGVGSNIEVLDAENTLKESQVNYYNALYDALIAKVNLDKAYGKLLPESKN